MKPLDPSKTINSFGFKSGVGVCAILIAVTAFQTQTASAGNKLKKLLGVGVGIAIGGAIFNDLMKNKKKSSRKVRRSRKKTGRSRRGNSGDAGGDEEDYVSARDAKNHAALSDELNEIERSKRLERERDVKHAISKFIGLLVYKHRNLKARGRSGRFVNQVTAGELERALDEAYKTGRLYQFDRFAGEMWTRDRLKVRVIRTAQQGLHRYFEGVGAKGPSMTDLNDLLTRSAHHVHANALEISEVIGVSNSFDRFIRTIFEYSDRADQNLWTTGADSRYERLVTTVMDSIPQPPLRANMDPQMDDQFGLQSRFQFRFRARRALYDCLSSRYPELVKQNAQKTTGGTGPLIQIKYNANGQQAKPAAQAPINQAASAKGARQIAGGQTYGSRAPQADHRGLQLDGAMAEGAVSKTAASNQSPSYELAQGSGEQNGARQQVANRIQPQNIWYRAKTYVGSVCRTSIEHVARQAYHGQIKPVSARWDSAAAGIDRQRAPRQLLYQKRQRDPGYGQRQQTGYQQGYEQRPRLQQNRAPDYGRGAPDYNNSGSPQGYYDQQRQPERRRSQYGSQGDYGRRQ